MAEAEKTAVDSFARVKPSFVSSDDRQVFTVELRPGDTTIVSWKKLFKDSKKVRNGSSFAAAAASAAGPSSSIADKAPPQPPDALPGQENEAIEATAPNRFSAVIEKIERLYKGKDSSDEEDLNDFPDDDQYDTEDSFIDDAELDEYFEVENASVKHNGFFVNRGKLECINENPAPPSQQPKKRRRISTKGSNGKDNGVLPNKVMKVGETSSEKDAAPVVSSSSNPSRNLKLTRECNEDFKASNQYNLSGAGPRKKSLDKAAHAQEGRSILEKAIRDLEKIVAESRLPIAENTDADISSQAVKRRLPTDIKLKLARVAKLASTHGKFSKELINRPNGIVGDERQNNPPPRPTTRGGPGPQRSGHKQSSTASSEQPS